MFRINLWKCVGGLSDLCAASDWSPSVAETPEYIAHLEIVATSMYPLGPTLVLSVPDVFVAFAASGGE